MPKRIRQEEFMEELAVFGGKPVREKPIFYGRQYIDQEDVEAVTKVLTADVITSGPQVSDLEKHLCETRHMQNMQWQYATELQPCIWRLWPRVLAKGDEVIVSSITFAASSNCVLYAGAKPVFADINPETYNIDPASIRKLITPGPRRLSQWISPDRLWNWMRSERSARSITCS